MDYTDMEDRIRISWQVFYTCRILNETMKMKHYVTQTLILYIIIFSDCGKEKSSKMDLSFLKSYSKEEIKHFEEIGFMDNNKLYKWNQNIRIKVDGQFCQDDLISVDDFIKCVDTLIPELSLKRVQNNENVTIYIQDSPGRYGGHIGNTLTHHSIFTGYYYNAKVWVTPTLYGTRRKETIHHELMHVLGFNDPDYKYMSGVLGIQPHQSIDDYEYWLKTYTFSDLTLAKSAIKIMYNKNIPVRLKRKDFIEEYNKYLKNE